MIRNKKILEIYIHIPFCVQKCLYCDFLSGPFDEKIRQAYLDALLDEISMRSSDFKDYAVDTVFIGGGTPSVVSENVIAEIISLIKQKYNLSDNPEITIEANPGTVDLKKLSAYRECGINRLSLGLQSANDNELKALGRIHDRAAFLDTYSNAVKAGFDNINVDIMSALPNQNMDSYLKTLEFVTGLNPAPKHISSYSLIVEEGTPFFDLHMQNKLNLPDEDTDREMYELTKEVLQKKGYTRYEISNYAMDGYECRHNIGYWKRVEYIGFGIGAASLISNERFENTADINKYINNPLDSRENVSKLSKHEQMEEFMFLGLRLMKGVAFSDFYNQFNVDLYEVYGDVIEKNVKDGLLKIEGEKYKLLSLTQRGIDVSNYIFSQFLFD